MVIADRTVNIQQSRPELHVRHVLTWAWVGNVGVSVYGREQSSGEDGSAMGSSETRGMWWRQRQVRRHLGGEGDETLTLCHQANNWWR